jgi:hypothetical protein
LDGQPETRQCYPRFRIHVGEVGVYDVSDVTFEDTSSLAPSQQVEAIQGIHSLVEIEVDVSGLKTLLVIPY